MEVRCRLESRLNTRNNILARVICLVMEKRQVKKRFFCSTHVCAFWLGRNRIEISI